MSPLIGDGHPRRPGKSRTDTTMKEQHLRNALSELKRHPNHRTCRSPKRRWTRLHTAITPAFNGHRDLDGRRNPNRSIMTMSTPLAESASTAVRSARKPVRFFALISDIHGNIDALDAVLSDIEQWPVRAILCLGDIVGYGPEPAACVQRVMETCAVSVIGNHEAMVLLAGQFPDDELRATVGAPITLAFTQLSGEQMKWLRDLPLMADLDPVTLSHAALHAPGSFDYIFSAEDAKAHFAVQTTFVSFHGHTHVPVFWEESLTGISCFAPPEKPVRLDAANRYAVNVGSVGQPRDKDPRACYALYDYESRLLLYRRVAYDIPRAQARFKKANLPAHNARRIKKGQ
jgi:diadenosine tetraphosphatase ApaH/serine/threonine PP2A family protein phosphatase